jgi:prepilin-type N-terminal cleavage/methylation domain-containing protein
VKVRSGLTLIELLVVIAIIGIVVTMIVPRLRMINEDQGAREAGRIVASRMSRASQEAALNGGGGFAIELNPNIRDQDNVQYAGTAIYLMKPVPSYSGDSVNALAKKENNFILLIPFPLEQNTRQIVRIGDSISVNNGSVRYRINGMEPFTEIETVPGIGEVKTPWLRLFLSQNSGMDVAGSGVGLATLPPLPGNPQTRFRFNIYRQPRIQESSRLALPEGYLLDLRYSGELVGPPFFPARTPLPVSGNIPSRTIFHEPAIGPLIKDRSLQVYHRHDGSIDFYQHSAIQSVTQRQLRIPSENLYFFLSRYESNAANENILSNPSPLDRPGNLWLVINSKTGGVTISYNVPPRFSGDFASRIREARQIAQSGVAAAD